MNDLIHPIQTLRDSVCAIMRVHEIKTKQKKNKPLERKFNVAFVGTGWCIVDRRYVVTAYHVFNNQQPRLPTDQFYVFVTPTNGDRAFHCKVTGFPFEDASLDMAVLEIDPPNNFALNAAPVTFRSLADGSDVLTLGYPAPIIGVAQIDQNGEWAGGQIFLKSHANEGIISAQYLLNGVLGFELNVGWHHGESGGPICVIDQPAVFAIMQMYRNITGPHGVMPGPHLGRSLRSIEATLKSLGARIV